jgi:hypothetical protein
VPAPPRSVGALAVNGGVTDERASADLVEADEWKE